MSLSYWIHPSISIFNLVLGLKAKKNKQNVLLGRQFQLFLSSKNAIGDMELSTQCYFLWAPASFWSMDSVTPAFVRLIMSQYRQEASLDPLLPPQPPSFPPTHTWTTTASNSHSICWKIWLCFADNVSPPEPLTWLTAFVFRIKYEADECVCGANYDIALRCQNILRTKFLHAGPQG